MKTARNPKGAGRICRTQLPQESKYAYVVALFLRYSPKASRNECAKTLGYSRNTVAKWWNVHTELSTRHRDVLKKYFAWSAEVSKKGQGIRAFSQYSGISIPEIKAVLVAEEEIHRYFL